MLDVSKLSREQWAALDITCLTVNQILEMGFENLTDKQIDAIMNGECSWVSREDAELACRHLYRVGPAQ